MKLQSLYLSQHSKKLNITLKYTDSLFLLSLPRVLINIVNEPVRALSAARRRQLLKKTGPVQACASLVHARDERRRVETRSKKEVFQPHLPVRLPCYDLAPVTGFALGRSLRSRTSGTPGFHGLTGGVYKARERIHRAMADARLLANPTSRSRVADSDPN